MLRYRVNRILSRSFHASHTVQGWQQKVAVGYGIPLPSHQYKSLEPYVMKIEKKCLHEGDNQEFVSEKPIIVNIYGLNDGFILFTREVNIHTTGWLINDMFLGPLNLDYDKDLLNTLYDQSKLLTTQETEELKNNLIQTLERRGINSEHLIIYNNTHGPYGEWSRRKASLQLHDTFGLYVMGIN